IPVFLSALIIDHTCTDITQIPESAILAAKDSLHIAYGHTSHGWQITYGMDGLVDFANNGGKGLSLPDSIFAFNNGGTGGALDQRDCVMDNDVGYYPGWVNETRDYLGDPDSMTGRGISHPEINVIMWSWCGQVDEKYAGGVLWDEYLGPMAEFEEDYPNVTFIYMTGHVDIYCENNDKVLFDFADFDRHDPDGTYYEFVNDNCDYYDSVGGTLLGNWALEWQAAHTEGVDWYSTPGSHTYPINENQKGYGAWWMWTRLAGWEGPAGVDERSEPDNGLTLSASRNMNLITNNKIDISFFIPDDGLTTIDAYDVSGKKISSIFIGYLSAGSHNCSWERNGKTGIIIIRLKQGSGATSIKLNCI
ncbi:MAG: hypothetical protein P8Z50_07325, partial [candidate division WOR-3 bacterium]